MRRYRPARRQRPRAWSEARIHATAGALGHTVQFVHSCLALVARKGEVVYSRRSLTFMRFSSLSFLPLLTILAYPAWAATPSVQPPGPGDVQAQQVFTRIPLRFEPLA